MTRTPADPWVLVLGTADWNQAIATNQHYMVRELAQEYRVTFVESLGLRRPELSSRDLKRIGTRLRGIVRPGASADPRPPRPVPPSVDVVSPVVLPVHTGLPRLVNRPLLHRSVRDWMDHQGPRVLWTYSPVTYGLERIADTVVYHCVDLLGAVPGISARMIDTNARRLTRSRVTAVGSSAVVVEELLAQGFDSPLLWPNVADVELVRDAAANGLRTERAVFAGNLSASKVDFALLHRVLDAGIHLDLAGPIAEGGGDSGAAVDRLVAAGAEYHGLLSLAELGSLYHRATVGLIPYLLNAYTVGVNPLKTYEYLAAGLAVVATPVPAVLGVDEDVFVESSDASFVRRVAATIGAPGQDVVDRRVALAERHSWTGRGVEARAVLAQGLALPERQSASAVTG